MSIFLQRLASFFATNVNEVFCVSDVAQQLGISQPAASQHIKILKNVGILEENRRGFRVFYTINRNDCAFVAPTPL
ncbi:ArsR/SmtB family transcription factor [Sporomusa acidovorans]|uniref:ArsR/SmtB family transcription factor n=1 Tax=Sporomusa acidovorans TaxID=112900 RepID=UPI000B827AA6